MQEIEANTTLTEASIFYYALLLSLNHAWITWYWDT